MSNPVTDIKFNPITTTMIETLTPLVTVNPETGLPTLPDNAFELALPVGQTLESVKLAQKTATYFEAAANVTLGTAFIEAAKANPELQNYTATLPVGHDKYHVNITREQQIPTGVGADAGKRTVYANTTSGIKSTRSEVKRAQQHIRSLGEVLRVANG